MSVRTGMTACLCALALSCANGCLSLSLGGKTEIPGPSPQVEQRLTDLESRVLTLEQNFGRAFAAEGTSGAPGNTRVSPLPRLTP